MKRWSNRPRNCRDWLLACANVTQACVWQLMERRDHLVAIRACVWQKAAMPPGHAAAGGKGELATGATRASAPLTQYEFVA